MQRECCEEMVKRGTPGIAIGGLTEGEKVSYCTVVDTCTGLLPEGNPVLVPRPIYLGNRDIIPYNITLHPTPLTASFPS